MNYLCHAATHRNMVSCAPTRTERCAGQGELVLGLAEHANIIAEGEDGVKREVLWGFCAFCGRS